VLHLKSSEMLQLVLEHTSSSTV